MELSQNEILVKPLTVLAEAARAALPTYQHRQLKTIEKHFTAMSIDDSPLIATEITNRLRRHLLGRGENSVKEFSRSHVDNLISSWKKAVDLYRASEAAGFEQIVVQQRDEWDAWFDVGAKSDSIFSTKLRHMRPHLERFIFSNPTTPADVNAEFVCTFGEYLKKNTTLNQVTTIPSYLTALRRVARVRKQIEEVKIAPRIPWVEAEIERYRKFATLSEKTVALIVERTSSVHKAVNWLDTDHYPQFIRKVVLHAQSMELAPTSLAACLQIKVIENLLTKALQEQSITRNTAKGWIHNFVTLIRFAYDMKVSEFENLDQETIEVRILKIKKLKKALPQFKKATRKDKLKQNPLPSPAEVFKKIDEYVNRLHSKYLKELKGNPELKKKIALGVKYRNLVESIQLIFIASRPQDMRTFRVDSTNQKVASNTILWKMPSGNYMLRYPPSKTDSKADVNIEVYALWPPRYTEILDTYLKYFRPLIAEEGDILYPASRLRQQQLTFKGAGGIRSRTTTTKQYRVISNRILGRPVSATEYRKILTNWYFFAGAAGYIAFVLGHSKNNTELTSVEIKHYLNISPQDAERLFLKVYGQLFAWVEEHQVLKTA